MQKEGRWKREQFDSFLRVCGIDGRNRDNIFKAGKLAREKKTANTVPAVDYNSPTHLSTYAYPASWNGDLELASYVEMIMHQIFLGVVQSGFELIAMWFTERKLGDTTFWKRAQPLLLYLKKLGRQWCLPYTFNESESGREMGTGGWVSENWLTWARLSKILYVFCIDAKEGNEKGAHNVCRLIVAQMAMIACIMTHSGMCLRHYCCRWLSYCACT